MGRTCSVCLAWRPKQVDGDARDVALKYREALRKYRHALVKHRYALSRFGTDSTMYSITERQLNDAAELLKEMLGGGLDAGEL